MGLPEHIAAPKCPRCKVYMVCLGERVLLHPLEYVLRWQCPHCGHTTITPLEGPP